MQGSLNVEIVNPHIIYEQTRRSMLKGALGCNLSSSELTSPIIASEKSSVVFAPDIARNAYFFQSELSLAPDFKHSQRGGFVSPSAVNGLCWILEQGSFVEDIQVSGEDRVLISAVMPGLTPEMDSRLQLDLGYRDREAKRRTYQRQIGDPLLRELIFAIIAKETEEGFPNEDYSVSFLKATNSDDNYFRLTDERIFTIQLDSYVDLYQQVINALHLAQGVQNPSGDIYFSAS